jgi:hypothetical protein
LRSRCMSVCWPNECFQIANHGRVAGFHFGHSGLARSKGLG